MQNQRKVITILNFIKKNIEELVMVGFVFLGSSILGIFALSHVYGLFPVLLSVCIGLLFILAMATVYEIYLEPRIYSFIIQIVAFQRRVRFVETIFNILKRFLSLKFPTITSRKNG